VDTFHHRMVSQVLGIFFFLGTLALQYVPNGEPTAARTETRAPRRHMPSGGFRTIFGSKRACVQSRVHSGSLRRSLPSPRLARTTFDMIPRNRAPFLLPCDGGPRRWLTGCPILTA